MNVNQFTFNGQQLRHILIDGEAWFAGADVCRHLGLVPNSSNGSFNSHYRKVDSTDLHRTYLSDGQGASGGRIMTMLSESGLYKLIMRSDKPEALVFQNWVTKEVIPSIRKTGGYLLNEAARPVAHADTKEAMPLPEGFAQMFQMLFAPIMKPLEDKIEAQGAVILSMKAHIEKMASGEEPSDVWLSGDLTRDMSDGHINNAIKWAKKTNTPHDVLTKEKARRQRLKKHAA